MVNQPAHSQPPSDSEEEKQEEYKDITEQDIQHLGFATQIFGALMLVKTQNYTTLKDAYAVLNDPKLAEKLLDFEHPEELLTARGAVVIANKEIRKKAASKRGYAETRFFLWKSHKLTQEQFKRATHSTYIAKRVNKIINKSENDIRFRNATNIFNISDENQFRTQVNEWMKKNPGRNIDDALYAVGVKSAKIKGQEANDAKKKLEEQNKGARKLAVAGNQTIIDRANEVIKKDILGPNKPEITHTELAKKLEYIEKGYYTVSPPKPAPTQSPTPQPQPATAPVPPTRVAQQPIISKIPFKLNLPSLNLSKIFHPFPTGSLFGKLDNFLKLGTKTINSKILGKIGAKAIGKLVGQALGSLIPGIGNAVAGILSALGIDEMITRFAFQAALFAVLVVVGLFVGMFFIFSDSNNLFSTPDSAMRIPQTAESQTTIYSWQEFEEKYLTTAYSP